ncbi:MAG: glycogen debranching protein GlgX [Spirochaetes bacterium]|jgi:glycogen operon protein|nr:glycogen debranching protein GlgX [Spirochaetota bacterium]
MTDELKTYPGSPLPLGANTRKNGTQFSIFSRNARSVSLVLFESAGPGAKSVAIELHPEKNKTGDIWHILVEGIKDGQLYGYRVDGQYNPAEGFRFNGNKLLVDPYSRSVSGRPEWNLDEARGYDHESPLEDLSFSETDSSQHVPKSIVTGYRPSNEDKPLNLPLNESVIYELHLKGYTVHGSSGVKNGGTYAGLTEKIPYLRDMGITAVELMPIQEFDETENININPLTGERLKNYWGYSTLSFFSPKGGYSASGCMGEQVNEFREMVKSFHKAGIEVILDVVFNHTSEGDQKGPTVSFRGIDNSVYYILEDDKRYYKNYSGCGNTFNCNHPFIRDFILDCLRYWVVEMNVDGFRFDLASILGRDQNGNITSNPPLIERIEEDPILRNTKIIAEAWDAAGAYQLGTFPGRWAEWNGKYRDDVRKFWNGGIDSAGAFATRLTGSSDLYQFSEKGPNQSINFITCHDGFTLNDLVSYAEKHNLENGENNLDGENCNYSCNFGIEGSDATPYIENLRLRQMKNFLATLFLSQGIPMILAGDEFMRTQKGNNNAYCQDNEISWINWSLLDKNRELFSFMKYMINFRKEHPILRRNKFFTGTPNNGCTSTDVTWHGIKAGNPDWSPESRVVAMLLSGEYAGIDAGKEDNDLFAVFNSSLINRHFELPDAPSGRRWRLAFDTSRKSITDTGNTKDDTGIESGRYYISRFSTAVFIA